MPRSGDGYDHHQTGQAQSASEEAAGVHPRFASCQLHHVRESRVLLIDDDDELLNVLIRSFRKPLPSVRLRTAKSGLEASTLLGSYLPNLIVLDINMPGMNGVQLLNFIRSHPRYADIKVLAMTGLSAQADEVQAMKSLGVEEIFFKPFKNEDLVVAVQTITAALTDEGSSGEATDESILCSLDVSKILERFEGDTELIATILDTFLEDYPIALETVERTLEAQDQAGFKAAVQHLRSSMDQISSPTLKQALQNLDETAERSDWQETQSSYPSIRAEIKGLAKALEPLTLQTAK